MSLADGLQTVGDVVALLEDHDVDVQDATDVVTDIDGEIVRASLRVVAPLDEDLQAVDQPDDTEESVDADEEWPDPVAKFPEETENEADEQIDSRVVDPSALPSVTDEGDPFHGERDGVRVDRSTTESVAEELGTYTAGSYGIALTGEVPRYFADVDRVTVQERDGGGVLVPGEGAEGPDYQVADRNIQLSTKGRDSIGADEGDVVRAVRDGDVVRLELIDDHEPDSTPDGTVEESADETANESGGDEDDVDVQDDEDVDGAEDDGNVETEGEASADTDDVPEYRRCGCGAKFDDSFAYYVHRTEDHGPPQTVLNSLQPGEFETIVSEVESVRDVVDATGWTRERVLRAFSVYGIADIVGPSDVELSDLNDFEFDGLVDDVEPGDGRDDQARGASGSEDPIADRDLDREAVIDALEGAQSVHHVVRDLPGAGREEVRDLLADLDLLDELEGGSARLQYADIEHLDTGVSIRA